MDSVIKLVGKHYVVNEIGVRVAEESSREVFATIRSTTRAEFYAAGEDGLRPEIVAIMPFVNYDGERLAEVNGVKYTAIRTYFGEGDNVEIYLRQKAGD